MVEHLFAGIPVRSRDAAIDWYERLLGRRPDLIPNDDEAAWQLTESAWIYLIADADRAGSALNTFLVEDLDALLVEIGARGIAGSPIEPTGDTGRSSYVTDPDGNRIKLSQVV
jgi:predicted enzyme related to lactoylglutathione lyase